MTSSLVGSEMCIRDRWRKAATRRGPWQFQQQGLYTVCGGSRLRMTAVSYTHLTLPTICSV
eukprot:536267-Prorocentrum_lima.AAC.1